MKPIKSLLLVLFTMAGLGSKTEAQVVVPPSLPSQVAGSLISPNPVTTVNCDMLEYLTLDGTVGFLKAIAWDDKNAGTANDVHLHISDGINTVNLSLGNLGFTAVADPDVVVGHDINNPGDFMVVMVVRTGYPNMGNVINLHWSVSGVGTGAMSVSFLPALSGNVGSIDQASRGDKPHIDLIPDPNLMIDGHPALHRMVTLHTTVTGQAFYFITEISNSLPVGIKIVGNLPLLPPGAKIKDVAAYVDVSNAEEHIVYSFTTGGGTNLWLGTFNATTLVFSFPLPLGTASSIPTAKIEAMNLRNPANGGATWQIAALMGNVVRGFNNLNIGGFNISTTNWDFFAPAVAAAAGRPSPKPSNVGNANYIAGFYRAADHVYNRDIAWNTGALVPPGTVWYQVSNASLTASGTDMYAISSASNSGAGILSAWSDGNVINFKESPNAMAFRTTGINETPAVPTLRAYPNPAKDKLYLTEIQEGTPYAILEPSGKAVRKGSYTSVGINVMNLAKGMYLLEFNYQNKSTNLMFTKF